MKRVYFTSLVLLSLLSTALAQVNSGKTNIIEKVFSGKGEVYFKLKIADKSEVNMLSGIMEVDNIKGDVVYCVHRESPKPYDEYYICLLAENREMKA